MASPVVQTFSSATGVDSSPTGTEPSGTAQGDLLIAFLALDRNRTIDTPPANWTLIQDASNNPHFRSAAYWIQRGASAPSYVWGISANADWVVAVVRLTGHAASPIDISGQNTGSDSTPTAPAVTTTVDECRIIYGHGHDANDSPYTHPSGTTELWDTGSGTLAGSSGAHKEQATAGDTGTGQFTGSTNDQWAAITIAIAPSAAPAETFPPLPGYALNQDLMPVYRMRDRRLPSGLSIAEMELPRRRFL